MNAKDVLAYLDLVDRRLFILLHSGVDWKPEYAVELKAIDKKLARYKKRMDQLRSTRREGCRA